MLMNPKLVQTLPGVVTGIGGASGGQVSVETETDQRLSMLLLLSFSLLNCTKRLLDQKRHDQKKSINSS